MHTVVDTGDRDSAGLRAALLLAQVAIIPIGASIHQPKTYKVGKSTHNKTANEFILLSNNTANYSTVNLLFYTLINAKNLIPQYYCVYMRFMTKKLLVPEAGIEPARPLFTKAADFKSDVSTNFTTRALLHASLHSRLKMNFIFRSGGGKRNRTALNGFAGRCITSLLSRHHVHLQPILGCNVPH